MNPDNRAQAPNLADSEARSQERADGQPVPPVFISPLEGQEHVEESPQLAPQLQERGQERDECEATRPDGEEGQCAQDALGQQEVLAPRRGNKKGSANAQHLKKGRYDPEYDRYDKEQIAAALAKPLPSKDEMKRLLMLYGGGIHKMCRRFMQLLRSPKITHAAQLKGWEVVMKLLLNDAAPPLDDKALDAMDDAELAALGARMFGRNGS